MPDDAAPTCGGKVKCQVATAVTPRLRAGADQPRSFDAWAVDQVAALVTEAREINPDLRALAFLNAADAQGRDNAEAQEALREISAIEILDLMVVRRKAFPNAAAQGRGVIEQQPRDAKAVEELAALAKAAFR